jgi:ribonuclease HI
MSEPASRRRHKEEVTNEQYIPRVRELLAQGGEFFIVKVLNHNGGYAIQCDVPVNQEQQIELPV